ncbi:MAG: hypothetical protein R3A45_02165 [Bdellovibrionota bacterium]
MMKLFSILAVLLCIPLVWAEQHSPAFSVLIQKIDQVHHIQSTLKTETNQYGQDRFEKAVFSIGKYSYRLIVKNKTLITFSSQKEGQIAYSVVYEALYSNQALPTIQEHIAAQQEKTVKISNVSGYTSLFEEDALEKQPDTISTANVLSWNRLLKDAYQGNIGSSLAGGQASSTGNGDTSSAYANATSMAKMMNQCGGNNKSQQAHKQAMQNIAQALVAITPPNSHEVARASEKYADQSQDYKKHAGESVIETLEKMKNVDTVALFQAVQSEKRKIEKSLQRNELSYIFTSDANDEKTLNMLKTLIKDHSRIKTLTQFQFIGRKLVIDQQYFDTFAKQPARSFLYISEKQVWAINPLLTSQLQYRKALVEILWSHMNKN